MLHKSKEKSTNFYLKLTDSLVKPIIVYDWEFWGDSFKKDCLANKIEKIYWSIYKLIKKNPSSNMKISAKLERTRLRINIEIQIFKYLQGLDFTEKERYV